MAAILQVESTLTDRYQTTIPETEVVLSRAEPVDEHDPVLGQFLDFLACDIASHTEYLQLCTGLLEKWHADLRGTSNSRRFESAC
ncbi:hypothetical protein [Rugamonas apoptosis]|uniref:Uncharacterized protein n=1 Tax=Rugamonas apoptosis TaxID=2758570 RepID=A0A7W2IM80_9BURK|nr:hypothetical protein [Rugamonas apoptosis]MBA5689403.1 hypothetical protein [Rugamonas apoptosis]